MRASNRAGLGLIVIVRAPGRFQRVLQAVAMALIIAILASACGGSVRVATSASRQGASVVGHSPVAIEASSDDITRLAQRANVQDEVIRDVAPALDDQPTWRNSLSGVRSLYDQVPQAVQEVLLGVACDGVNGEISSYEDLYVSVASNLAEYPADQLSAFTSAARDLWSDLYQAQLSEDPDVRASAVLTCFTIEQILSAN